MPDPKELLDAAWLLHTKGKELPPGNGYLRRAVSTAYYAVFHHTLRAAAERFVGTGRDDDPAFVLIYRGYDHGRMRGIFSDLQGSKLKQPLVDRMRREVMGPDVRDFAATFEDLQTKRHNADYDPAAVFEPSDVFDIIVSAEAALVAFDRIPPDEKADVLALLLVGNRK